MSGPRLARRLLLCGAGGWALLALILPKPWHLGITSLVKLDELLSIEQYVSAGLMAAAILNLIACLVLAATARFWAQPLAAEPEVLAPAVMGKKARLFFWLAVLGAVVLGGVFRWPMAHSSLWWDEAWEVRHAVVGELVPHHTDPQKLDFHRIRWIQTFWRYDLPTNHVTFSITSRAALTVWRAATGRETWEFDEFSLRLPSLLAGLAGIAMLALLLREWGYPLAGVAGAFLLAIHPWHIRYSCDARAYAILLLLGTLALLLLTRALRQRSWRCWLSYGVVVFLTLWTFPYALYLVGFLGLAALVTIFWKGWRGELPRLLAARLCVAHALAAMLLLPMVAPHMLQIRHWDTYASNAGTTEVKSFRRDLWSSMTLGVPYSYGKHDKSSESFPSFANLSRENRWILRAVWRGIPALILLGFLTLLIRGDARRWIAIAPALGVVVAVTVAVWSGQFLYLRFVIYGLLSALVLSLIGLDSLGRLLGLALPPRARPFAVPALLLLALSAYYGMTRNQRHVLATRPIAPTREAVDFVRQQGGDDPLGVIRAGYLSAGAMPQVYDPWTLLLREPGDVLLYAREAARQGKPFYVFGFDNAVKKKTTNRLQFLLDDPDFEEVAKFDGSEPKWSHRIFKYRGPPGEEPVWIPYGNWFVISHDNPDYDGLVSGGEGFQRSR